MRSSRLAPVLIAMIVACGGDKRSPDVDDVVIDPLPVVNTNKVIPETFIGINYVAAWASPAPWPGGAGVYRVHDATPRWDDLHIGPGTWDEERMKRMDAVLIHFRQRYAPTTPTIYVIAGDPERAIPEWIQKDTLIAFREHVTAIVERYGEHIDYYELWNEPDSWFQGSALELLDLVRVASGVIRLLDPTAKIIGPSFTQDGHVMMDAFYSVGGAQYVDIIGWHHGVTNPEADTTHILEVRRVLAKHEIYKPLWATEINVLGGASELMRTYLIHWLYGVEHVGYYSWEMPTYYGDDEYAHTARDDGSITEAGDALIYLMELLPGQKVINVSMSEERWTIELNGTRISWIPGESTMPTFMER